MAHYRGIGDGYRALYRGFTETGHRWSGWPGAWCLDCGVADAIEIALGENWVDIQEGGQIVWLKTSMRKECEDQNRICRYPGSHMWDPYYNRSPYGEGSRSHRRISSDDDVEVGSARE